MLAVGCFMAEVGDVAEADVGMSGERQAIREGSVRGTHAQLKLPAAS